MGRVLSRWVELGLLENWVLRSIGGILSFFVIPGIDLYSDSKIGAIYEGTSNIQMDTIFRQLSKQYGKGN